MSDAARSGSQEAPESGRLTRGGETSGNPKTPATGQASPVPGLAEALEAEGVVRIDADAVAERIGIPVDDWAGSCYGIAVAMLEHGLLKGRARYGRYCGTIAKGTMFDRGAPPIIGAQHGWIESENGERIVDPTRYVFEGAGPYVYVGPALDEDYDIGGQGLRSFFMSDCPLPDPKLRQRNFRLSEPAYVFLTEVVGMVAPGRSPKGEPDTYSINDACLRWLAHVSPMQLGKYAREVYDEMKRIEVIAWVPIDNVHYVYGSPYDNV